MAKLYFRYGAMGSSKTANAIMVQYNYTERGQRALMLKPRLDNRDGDRFVGSRSGLRAPCSFVEELDAIDVERFDCVIVDEAQFLTRAQVERLVQIVDEMDIPVICYGLRADFQGNLFEGSALLMAWADTIEEIKTVCWCGRKATYNARICNGAVIKTGAQIQLGGNESYVALCRKHWASGELAQTEIKRISIGKRDFLALLKEADPNEENLLGYLDAGDMYALTVCGKPVSLAILLRRDDARYELMNLVTAEEARGKGCASKLLRHIFGLYRPMCQSIEVGTDEDTAAFYERLGFVRCGVIKDYFREHYPNEPVGADRILLNKAL